VLDTCAIQKATERKSWSTGADPDSENSEKLDTCQRDHSRHFRLPPILALEWELEVDPFGEQCSGTKLHDHSRADR